MYFSLTKQELTEEELLLMTTVCSSLTTMRCGCGWASGMSHSRSLNEAIVSTQSRITTQHSHQSGVQGLVNRNYPSCVKDLSALLVSRPILYHCFLVSYTYYLHFFVIIRLTITQQRITTFQTNSICTLCKSTSQIDNFFICTIFNSTLNPSCLLEFISLLLY